MRKLHTINRLFTASFFKSLIMIALPVSLQNLFLSMINMADNIMIGQLGDVPIAAVGLSNQIFFVFVLIVFGISTASAIFTAQYWGSKDVFMIKKVQGLSLILSGVASIIFGTMTLLIPEILLSLYTKDSQVIITGASYMRITGFCYLFTGGSISMSLIMRTVKRPFVPLIGSAVSMFINISINWLLIFGNLGFPCLGVRGAAIGTLIARIVEFLVIVISVYYGKYPNAGTFKEMFHFHRKFLLKFFKTATPVILNESVWVLGMTSYSIIYGRISTEAVASYEIANSLVQVAFIFYMGTANASSVMIGNRLGYGSIRSAVITAYRFVILAPIMGVFIGIGYYLMSGVLPSLFMVSDTTQMMIRDLMIALAIIIPIKGLNLHLIVGIFRSGGDTRFSLMLDIGSIWLIGIPLAFFCGWVLKLPVYAVFLISNSEEIIKAIIGIMRLRSRLWTNVLTDKLSLKNVPTSDYGI